MAARNLVKRPRPATILFSQKPRMVIVCGEGRCTRLMYLDEDAADGWKYIPKSKNRAWTTWWLVSHYAPL
jgi:hypothetical protein